MERDVVLLLAFGLAFENVVVLASVLVTAVVVANLMLAGLLLALEQPAAAGFAAASVTDDLLGMDLHGDVGVPELVLRVLDSEALLTQEVMLLVAAVHVVVGVVAGGAVVVVVVAAVVVVVVESDAVVALVEVAALADHAVDVVLVVVYGLVDDAVIAAD